MTSLRWRQMRNMHLALMVSQGTPMVLMGDEYGHTRKGNNNTYGHDNELNNFDWSALEAQREQYFRYHSGLVKFRLAHPLLGRAEFLNDNDITWHETTGTTRTSCSWRTRCTTAARAAAIYTSRLTNTTFSSTPLCRPPPGANLGTGSWTRTCRRRTISSPTVKAVSVRGTTSRRGVRSCWWRSR